VTPEGSRGRVTRRTYLLALALLVGLPLAGIALARWIAHASAAERKLTTPTRIFEFPEGHHARVSSVDFSPDGRYMLSRGFPPAPVVLWDIAAGRERWHLTRDATKLTGARSAETSVVTFAAFHPDGRRAIVKCAGEPTVRLYDIESGASVGAGMNVGRGTHIVVSSPSSAHGRMLVQQEDKTWHIWDLERKREIGKGVLDREMRVLTVSLDGRTALATKSDYQAFHWDLERDRELRQLDGHVSAICVAALSPDGRRAATGDYSGVVILWDLTRQTGAGRLAGRLGEVRALAFSPDGRRILSADGGEVAILWDAGTGEELCRFVTPPQEGRKNKLIVVAFHPDGRRVVAAGKAEVVFLPGEIRVLQPRMPPAAIFIWEVPTDLEIWAWRLSGRGDKMKTAKDGE